MATTQVQGQFYAPDTEYHDPVQRVFIVEAARVLARAEANTNLEEVTYQLRTKPDSNTVWEVHWLDGTGKSVKNATVSYGSDLLKRGPDFYRTTFTQLWQAGWKRPTSKQPAQVTEAFWRGAARTGLSREESLAAAFPLTRASGDKDGTQSAPELAERYEVDSGGNTAGKLLLKFLPLLPALRDPAHPQRREALEFFGKAGSWTTLRLIWIEKYKIPTADAIVLLGGRENNAVARVVIAYLEKDRPRGWQEFGQLVSSGETRSEMKVLCVCLLDRLESHPHDDKDLRPATGGQSIRRLVMQQLGAEGAK